MNYLRKCHQTYGNLKKIWSDNRPQLNAGAFKQYLKDHTIKHKPSYPYWSEGNDEVEQFNQTICKLLQTAMLETRAWQFFTNVKNHSIFSYYITSSILQNYIVHFQAQAQK